MKKKTVFGIVLLTAIVLICGAVLVLSLLPEAGAPKPASSQSAQPSEAASLRTVSDSSSEVAVPSRISSEAASEPESEAASQAVSRASSKPESKTSSAASSEASSEAESEESSEASGEISSGTESEISSQASGETSSKTESRTSSAVSGETSSDAGSRVSSQASAEAPSAVSKTLSEIFSERIEIFNDPVAFAEVMDDYTNSYWSDGFMRYLISYCNTLEFIPPESESGAYTPTATQAERLAMLKSDTVTVSVGGSKRTVTYYEALRLILANELSYGYDEETLKAQLVCSYTFLRYHAGCGRVPSVGFASQLVQETRWGEVGMAQIDRLIAEVGGLLVTVDGHPAFTTYGALSNGQTNTVKDAWGGTGIDNYGTPYDEYMPSVRSPWCTRVKKFETTPEIPAPLVKELLESYYGITLSENKADWIRVTGYNAAGYGMTAVIDGQEKTTPKVLRDKVFNLSNVGYDRMLRSYSYSVTYLPDDDVFRFVVHGYGHGVGFSQYGAEEMAKEGKTWRQIIQVYFPGVTVPAE